MSQWMKIEAYGFHLLFNLKVLNRLQVSMNFQITGKKQSHVVEKNCSLFHSWKKGESGSHWGPITDTESFNSSHFSKFPLSPQITNLGGKCLTLESLEDIQCSTCIIICHNEATISQYGFTRHILSNKINQDGYI
jgi:hypothetical protein